MARRRGSSLLENLVVLSILGILTAIMLPAIQAARAAARRVACSNNLKGMGLALHAYLETHRQFPLESCCSYGDGITGEVTASNGFSVLARLLPHLGASAVYESINFHDQTVTPPGMLAPYAQNHTAMTHRLAVFVCPAEISALLGSGNNYRASLGPESNGRWGRRGVFRICEGNRMERITDGASQTIAFSEKVKGDADSTTFTPTADFFLALFTYSIPDGAQVFDELQNKNYVKGGIPAITKRLESTPQSIERKGR